MVDIYAEYLRFVQATGQFFIGWEAFSGRSIDDLPHFVTDYQDMFGMPEGLFV